MTQWLEKFSPDLIIYDLDGTLVNSLPDIIHAVNLMRSQLSLSSLESGYISSGIGKGRGSLMKKIMSDAPELIEQSTSLFEQCYQASNGVYSKVFPGVEPFLQKVRNKNIIQAVVTNKLTELAEILITNQGLGDYFSSISGVDTFKECKPHPMPLLEVMKSFKILPEKTIMIGDSINDVTAAKSAGVRSVGVTYGYNHGDSIASAKPDWIVDRLDELL